MGVVLLAVPGWTVRTLGVESRPGSRLLVRTTGVRDLAIGVGTLRALTRGRGARTWVQAGAACDAVDAVVLVGASGELGVGPALAGVTVAGGAAVIGAKIAADLDE